MHHPTFLLLAASDALDRTRIRRILEQSVASCVVFEAGNAAEAAAILSGESRLDLILADEGLLGLTCRDLCLMLNEHRPGVPFLLISPSGGQEVELEPGPQEAICDVLRCDLEHLGLVTGILLKTMQVPLWGPPAVRGDGSSQVWQDRTLRALNKAALAVQQARTPDEVYDAVAKEMDLLGYHTLILARTLDGKHLRIERMAVTADTQDRIKELMGLPAEEVQFPLSAFPDHQRILRDKEAVFIPDLVVLVGAALPPAVQPAAERLARMLSLRRGILAPLVVVGQVKGVIVVSADTLSEADQPAVTAFADQISAALERARLFAELQEREWRSTIAYEMAQQYAQELKEMVHEEQGRRAELDRLNKALRLFADELQSRQNETAIAQLLCKTTHDALGWQQVLVWLQDQQTMAAQPVAQVGYRPEIAEQLVSLVSTLTEDAPWMRTEFRQSHSYYVPDVGAILALAGREGVRCIENPGQAPDLLVVPLEAGGRLLGALLPSNREIGQRPTGQQIEHLELFAAQAAIAIESLRLSKSVQMWADAVRHSGDAIFITDMEGKILSANPAFEALTGYELAEATGQMAPILESSLASPELHAELWSTIQNGASWRGEVIDLRKNGCAYDADLTVAPILGLGGEIIGFVGSERDITPIKELDRLKSQFVSNVSHELRTPLTNIKLYQRYLHEGRRPNMRDHFFAILDQETQRLELIIESLLDFSRLETGSRPFRSELLDLNELVGRVVAERQPVAESQGITLVFEPCPELPEVMADPQRMGLVFNNLVTNALNYTSTNGKVWITTRAGERTVQVNVRDTGCGIAPEEMGHIFDKFYRGQASVARGVAGAGLGLSIVRQILDLHRGTIEVKSQVGEGTEFTITLPAVERSRGALPVAP
jgi:PAS domain S-box-containing protein